MLVCTIQWRVEIGIFDAKCKVRFPKKLTLQKANFALSFCSLGIFFLFVLPLLLVFGDTELNPGPRKRDTCYNLPICLWNLNITAAHSFEKVNLLKAYNTVNKFNIICLSETYLDSSIVSDNDNLVIKGYKLVRDDHSTTLREAEYVHTSGNPCRWDVCMFNTYLKNALFWKYVITIKKCM